VDTSNDDELSTAVKNIQQIVNDFVNSQTSKLKQGIEKIGTGNSDDVKMAGQQEDDSTSENRL
jgi:DNA anti-recombination protein RmuC